VSATGGGVDWNSPTVIEEGMLTNPGDRSYTLVNIPLNLLGGKYVGSRTWPDGDAYQWVINVDKPTTVYIWVLDAHNGGIASAPHGWTLEYDDRPYRGNRPGKLYSKYVTDSVALDVSGLLAAGALTAPPSSSCPPPPAGRRSLSDVETSIEKRNRLLRKELEEQSTMF